MKLSERIFVSFLVLLTLFGITLAGLSYLKFSNRYSHTFNDFYLSVNQSIADTLAQLDQETNTKVHNVKSLIQKDEKAFEKYTNEELKELSKKWSVSHLYTIRSSDGKFLTSSCEPPEQLPSIYQYCAGYRLLAEGKLDFELTPLVFGNPEKEAYKFFHFPSKDRKKIFEIALHARFISRTLKKTIEAYEPIISIGLFSPNGDSLGLFFKNKDIGRTEKIQVLNRTYPYLEESHDKVIYFTRVPSEIKNCCECKQHLDGGNEFSYILRTEVSKHALNDTLKETVFVIAFVLLVTFIISIVIARLLARRLTEKLNIVNKRIFAIIESGELKEKVIVNGDDEIDQLSINFNQMIDRLREASSKLVELEKSTAIVNLVKVIGHEVRRPFSMIKSLLQMLDGSQSFDAVKHLVKSHIPDIKHAIQSVESMLDDINNFGKKVKLKQDPVVPEEIILKSLNEICQIVSRDDITLKYNFQHSKLLFVDRTKVQQLFSNIILNAMQVMPKDSTLSFESKDVNGLIQFCIGNTGTFIEQDDLDEVFKLFFTRNKTNGNGLGLAIAHKVVADHGGKIWCESSKEAMKVEFFFTLPYTKFFKATKIELPASTADILQNLKQLDSAPLNVIIDPKEIEFEQEVVKKIKKLQRPLVIGVIEDEAIYVNALKELVSHSAELNAHIRVTELKDADTALSYLRSSTPDMLICDVDLGVNSINGFELVEKLRSEPYKFAKTICMHSNRCLPEDYERAIKMGAQSFLPKPMSRVHLLKLILNS